MNDAPPTRERVGPAWTRRRWASVVTGLIVLVTGGISVARWTLIPLEIDSTVESTSWVDSTTGRLRILQLDDGRNLVIDRELLERAGGPEAVEGATVRKDRWESTLDIGGSTLSLRVSGVVWRTLLAILFLVALGGWLRRRTNAPMVGTGTRVPPGSTLRACLRTADPTDR